MKYVICPVCHGTCVRNGKNKSGSQRWLCRNCNLTFTARIDNSSKQLQVFLDWLFSKKSQREMPGEGRTFRRKTSQFWQLWPMCPKIEESRDVVFVDGIYLGRKACVLICCDKKHVLGWYLCRYEHSGAWAALMSRIAEPRIVVSDGGSGFAKALRKVWPHARHQRCVFHAFCQVRRYTTGNPQTHAGIELLALSRELLALQNKAQADDWIDRFVSWMSRYNRFLSQKTYDENGNERYTHERLIKAHNSLCKLVGEGTLFTYLDEDLQTEIGKIPSMSNQIEGGINARLRAMLREHRGLSIERRIKAVFWWCYMHSPQPLKESELLKAMPTDKSIADIYKKMSAMNKLQSSIPQWGDAIVWEELHRPSKFINNWD